MKTEVGMGLDQLTRSTPYVGNPLEGRLEHRHKERYVVNLWWVNYEQK